MADERSQRPFVPRGAGPGGRPPFAGPRPGGFTPRPPFPSAVPRPMPMPAADAVHSVRVRDGERELEVHGAPVFCRQVLDELPALLARLRGEAAPTRPAISLPPAAPATAAPARAADPVPVPVRVPEPAADAATPGNGHGRPTRRGAAAPLSLDDQVVAVIRDSKHPIGIAGIRAQLGTDVSGQSVRRILERDQRVVSVGGKPAAYSLR